MPDPVQGLSSADAVSAAGLRVLVINFTLDDDSPVLPWQSAIARSLARRVGAVHVFTEWLGAFPNDQANLTFDAMPHWPFGVPRSLGSRWLMIPKLMATIRRFKPDVCFIHMAHEWSYRIGPYLRARGVPVLLWYAHGSVTRRLHLSTRFASSIVTSTPEGFRIDTPKRKIIGQAIDTGIFQASEQREHSLSVVSVGRISRRKRVDLLIEAFAKVLSKPGLADARLELAGPQLTDDDNTFRAELDALVSRLGIGSAVTFHGGLAQRQLATLNAAAGLHVNVSETGSMDKTVMEALACGCPVLTSNPAFFDEFAAWPDMLIRAPDASSLADRISDWLQRKDKPSPATLRAIILGRHDFEGFADKITRELQRLAAEKRAEG
jgi:glycosyltransferase involved in cell wall biosynthesis